jgi:hypothetical protein
MKIWLHLRLEIDFRHHLRHTITYGGDSQQAYPSTLLGDFYRSNGWGKVAAGRHPIPDFVKVVLQVRLESFQALSIYACDTFVCFYLLKGR